MEHSCTNVFFQLQNVFFNYIWRIILDMLQIKLLFKPPVRTNYGKSTFKVSSSVYEFTTLKSLFRANNSFSWYPRTSRKDICKSSPCCTLFLRDKRSYLIVGWFHSLRYSRFQPQGFKWTKEDRWSGDNTLGAPPTYFYHTFFTRTRIFLLGKAICFVGPLMGNQTILRRRYLVQITRYKELF